MQDEPLIQYVTDCAEIRPAQLAGFFRDWADPPSPETHLQILRNSDEFVLALDRQSGQVVGFVTAITDRVLSAYLSLLEVRPAYRHRGIGTELVRRILDRLRRLYMIDLICDVDLEDFYASLGMRPARGMMVRNYGQQSGDQPETPPDPGDPTATADQDPGDPTAAADRDDPANPPVAPDRNEPDDPRTPPDRDDPADPPVAPDRDAPPVAS